MADYGDGFNRVDLRGQGSLPFNSTRYGDPSSVGEVEDAEVEWHIDESGNAVGSAPINRISGHRPFYADGSDAYANDKQFWISVQHVPSQEYVQFKAFINSFNETYNSDWSSEHVFGRIDPIYQFKNTGRSVTLNLNIPAASESEAYENLAKIGLLTDMLYPNYGTVGSAQTLAQSPMIRLKVMNLLASQAAMRNVSTAGQNGGFTFGNLSAGHNSSPSRGQLGVITALTVNHNLEKTDNGVMEMGVNTILPKLIDISIDFKVIHEVPRGWTGTRRNYSGGPYGLDIDNSRSSGQVQLASEVDAANRSAFDALKAEQQRLDEEDEREIAQQARENEIARMHDVFGANLASGMLARQDARQGRRAIRQAGLDRSTSRYVEAVAGVDYDIFRMNYETDEDYVAAIGDAWVTSEGDTE